MEYIVTGQEMKDCDKRTIEHYKVPSLVLMERAALSFVEEFLRFFNSEFTAADTLKNYRLTVGILCGTGNNGGDGLAIARLLYQKQIKVNVILIGEESHMTKDCRRQLDILHQYNVSVSWIRSETDISILKEMGTMDIYIDAVFGVGLSREITGMYKTLFQYINEQPAKVAAVDLPSGIHSDTGQVLGIALKAELTVTFAFTKAGLVFFPGAGYAGKVIVKEIGITTESLNPTLPRLYSLSAQNIKQMLPPRRTYSNKGTYGKVVLFAGSEGMAGAACLAGEAAYRAGCGLVRIVTPESNRTIIQTRLPEAVITTYTAKTLTADRIKEVMEWADVIGIGCGLGLSDEAVFITKTVLKYGQKPTIADGDGLNIIANNKELLNNHNQPLLITPHLLEMARLTGRSVRQIQQNLVTTAVDFSKEYQLCCVLKDARTLVTDGNYPVYVNLTGNNGMATGGSGDVLAGMICGMAAQGMDLNEAGISAVFLHGKAGDAAAVQYGKYKMLAQNIIEHMWNDAEMLCNMNTLEHAGAMKYETI